MTIVIMKWLQDGSAELLGQDKLLYFIVVFERAAMQDTPYQRQSMEL